MNYSRVRWPRAISGLARSCLSIHGGFDLQTRAVICASRSLVNCFAERTPTFVVMYVVCTTRVTAGGCSVQHANALLLCCIAQRPDIEAETRVVMRRQDADELILCYLCVSHQHM